MKPAPFELFRPKTLNDALALLSAYADTSKVLAGGQSLVPLLNLRMSAPEQLIDLNRIADLSSIRVEGNDLIIGAMTRQQVVLDSDLVRQCAPLLTSALSFVGHVQTRSRGTIGGSIAHADPSAEIPLAMVALDATIRVRSKDGERMIASGAFFQDALLTALEPSELIVDVRLPVAPRNAKVSFREISRREGDFAMIAVAAQRSGLSNKRPKFSAAVSGLRTTPIRCESLCDLVASGTWNEASLERQVRESLDGIEPVSDIYASADYRHELAVACLTECLAELVLT